MCRFLAYAGRPILLADLLYRPTNSLITQSHKARERPEPLNGDGFGVGWYVHELDAYPCVQGYVTPAWSNRNLKSLAWRMRATCLFAHVRAASPGMAVTDLNVHPFSFDRFMWMHNGSIAEFQRIKRRLRGMLRDELYNMIQGTTDSEHAFALFLNCLGDKRDEAGADELRRALVETIEILDTMTTEAGIQAPSYYNFAVTDGRNVVVSRYCSKEGIKGASLHYSRGSLFECNADGVCDMHSVPSNDRAHSVIVASESLTDDKSDWEDVPDNHTITVLEDLGVKIERI